MSAVSNRQVELTGGFPALQAGQYTGINSVGSIPVAHGYAVQQETGGMFPTGRRQGNPFSLASYLPQGNGNGMELMMASAILAQSDTTKRRRRHIGESVATSSESQTEQPSSKMLRAE